MRRLTLTVTVFILPTLIGQISATFVTEENIHEENITTSISTSEATLYSHNETEPVSIYDILPSTTESVEEEERHKFVSTPEEIILEHTDFVTLRLQHLLNQTTSNLTELRILQQVEFNTNSTSYRDGWEHAVRTYNESKKSQIFSAFANSSVILNAPEEYHIALIAYSGPFIYYDFNDKTRALCSGLDIDNYEYKSFFKLLELAIEHLGPEIQRLTSNYSTGSNRTTSGVLYRGVSRTFALKLGQKLAFQHFISTSKNPNVANGFSWGSGATVFEIHAERKNAFRDGVYIGIHSIYSGEEEVLLSPLQIFQVESILSAKDEEHEKGIVRVVLQTVSIIPPTSPARDEDCVFNLEKLNAMKEYGTKLKLAVSILGAILCTFLLVGGIISLYMVVKGRRFCYKRRTDSELQLT